MSLSPFSPAGVVSPCVNICQMDEISGLCRGCFRTLDEITSWSRAAVDDKLAILAAVDRRRAEHDPCLLYTSPTPRARTRYRIPSSV